MKNDTKVKRNLGGETVKTERDSKEVIPKRIVGENITPPDPEVLSTKKVRRRHTSAYKRKILEASAECSEGELGALLRKEGLYSSNLSLWRKQRESGINSALTDKKRGIKSSRDKQRIKELEREKADLDKDLKKARMVIEVQKKISEIFLPETLPLLSVNV